MEIPRAVTSPVLRGTIEVFVAILIVIAIALWFMLPERLLSYLFALVAGVLWWRVPRLRGPAFACIFVAGMLVIPYLPFDVSLRVRWGLPHFARVEYGLPTREGWAMAERGDIVIGGCLVPDAPHQPRWILIW